jgi:hypothetical protein
MSEKLHQTFVIASPTRPGVAMQLDCIVAPPLAMAAKRES